MKKGFTLIELLAVIVILAIIALIASPIIINVIENVNKDTFKISNQNIVDRIEKECIYNKFENKDIMTYSINDGEINNIDFKGKMPDQGVITLNSSCKIKLWTHNNKYCAIKSYDETNIKVGKISDGKCIINDKETIDLNQHKTAHEISSDMGVGWNLGNTLETYITPLNGNETVERFETYWGNPVTTKAMIDKVKQSGFKTLRLPITWFQHIDESGKIDINWLNRVKEIVDYGIDNDMYVIIDTHHEKWLDLGNESEYQNYKNKLVNLWEQITEYFKDYDQHLMFEIMNEPRDIDGELEWYGNEKMNNAIIDLSKSIIHKIREISAEKRIVIVTPYSSRINYEHLKKIQQLDDGYTMISVHSYEPHAFTSTPDAVFDNSVVDQMYNSIIDIIKRFKENYTMPILITEMGCDNKNDYKNWKLYIEFYVEQVTKLKVPFIVWDTGKIEDSGLLDRVNLKWANENQINDLFDTYNNSKKLERKKLINRMQKINTSENYTVRNINNDTKDAIKYGVNKIDGINHYYIKADKDYIHNNSVYFRFNDTFEINSKDGFILFNCNFKTNSKKMYIRAMLNFYDEFDNLLYADDYVSNVLIDTENNTDYGVQTKTRMYYVPGAKKVKIDRISTSASFQGNGAFDIELFNFSLTDGTSVK